MRSDFAAFILTNGRPENVVTYDTLRKSGYTGRIFLLVDDLDETRARYVEKYGSEVVVFDKRAIAKTFDNGDNFYDMRAIVYARNAAFDVAEKLGVRYFVQLDDDYTSFQYRFDDQMQYAPKTLKNLDAVFSALLEFLMSSGADSIALAQGGDFIGGENSALAETVRLKRKCMNSFFCKTSRRFSFVGRVNEDVNTYTRLASTGKLFFTTNQVNLNQLQTQSNPGGMTELYLDSGTFLKSFYSVIYQPSSVRIGVLRGRAASRLHHQISWANTTPMILSERFRKVSASYVAPAEKSILGRIGSADLDEYLDLCSAVRSFDRRKAKAIALAAIRGEEDDAESELKGIWYKSLQAGKPDYSVYDHDLFISNLWACWVLYSRKYLLSLVAADGLTEGGSVASRANPSCIIDLGCGFGYSTAGLKELFPNAEVTGTNLRESFQFKVAEKLGQSHGFRMIEAIEKPTDLVFASEYFEHFYEPIAHLRDVLDIGKPKALVIANAFGTESIGHFEEYLDRGEKISGRTIGRAFNNELRERGYKKAKTRFWNSRPTVWFFEPDGNEDPTT